MKVTVIVTSYNRPKLLREALESIVGADEVIIVDDGSNFDVAKVLGDFKFPSREIIINHDKTTDIATARMPHMINAALEIATGDIVTYLSDDDLFSSSWISDIRNFMESYPKYHFVKCYIKAFSGEQDPETAPAYIIQDYRQLILGNFAHKRTCFTEEGIRWDESKSFIGADRSFLDSIHDTHDTWCIPTIPKFGLYRREHEYNLMKLITDKNPDNNSEGDIRVATNIASKLYKSEYLE